MVILNQTKNGNEELPGPTLISPHTSSWLYLAFQSPCCWCWASFAQWLKHRTNNPSSFVADFWCWSVSGRDAGAVLCQQRRGEVPTTLCAGPVQQHTPGTGLKRGLLGWKELLGQFIQHKAGLCCGQRWLFAKAARLGQFLNLSLNPPSLPWPICMWKQFRLSGDSKPENKLSVPPAHGWSVQVERVFLGSWR